MTLYNILITIASIMGLLLVIRFAYILGLKQSAYGPFYVLHHGKPTNVRKLPNRYGIIDMTRLCGMPNIWDDKQNKDNETKI